MAEETRDANAQQQMAQTLFNKGFAAFERGNLDIAADLLMHCVELSPGFSRARRFLRAAEFQKTKNVPRSQLGAKITELTSLPQVLKINFLLKSGKSEAALVAAEKLLRRDPLQRKAIVLLANAAEAAGHTDAAILTLEVAVEYMPDDMDLIKRLGDAYIIAEDYGKARDCYNQVLEARPTDMEMLKLLKDAEAHNTMKAGGWNEFSEKKDGYRDLLRDKEQAEKLDIQAKAQTVSTDADKMLEDYRAKIADDPANLNYRRALARLFLQQKRFADAITTLEEAQKIHSSDPELDRNLSAARVQQYNVRITDLRTKGDVPGADALEKEKNAFVFTDLSSRVERYPNDLRLRFELGAILFEQDRHDDAIQQLQMAQRSPKDRNAALYYLARCFRAKGQNDMATMQLETALEQVPIMDDNRKKILMELGELAEQAGDTEKAFNFYREIYGADIAYRDIGQKMERIYKARQDKKA